MKKFISCCLSLLLVTGTVVFPDSIYAGNFTEISAAVSDSSVSSENLDGFVSYNVLDNQYDLYHSTVVNSYIFENEDNTFTRVENTSEGILVEAYSKEGKKKSSVNIESELNLFGGFFNGEDANYFVFGQKNPEYDDSTEVVRVVKYSKDWKRISSASLYGANTYIPFEGGSLRMTETSGKLYVHTCHEMYATDDGYNHQANLTFVVNEADMKITESNYNILNIVQSGYVSHSFNQYIANDGEYIYRVDHGDAHPRGISIVKTALSNIKKVNSIIPFEISGTIGDNYTGVSVGGFELSDDNCIIAGNSVNQDAGSDDNALNIFLIVSSKSLKTSKTIWLTDYNADVYAALGNPHLVKINNNKFIVMWQEYQNDVKSLKYAVIDADGNIINGINNITMDSYCLSDCKPVKFSDGTVKWYVTDKENAVLYSLDTGETEETEEKLIKGDLNGDSDISVVDYMIMLKYIFGVTELTENQKICADMNGNGKVNVLDMVYLKNYLLG